MSSDAQPASYEMASVLFMDIVSYSLGSIEDQTELLTELQAIVRQTEGFKLASAKDELLSLPTGDGMALVFLHDPIAPAKCALEIAAALKGNERIRLRMGLHIGPVRRHADIRENMNVVGGGINMAQRVMDCGDNGHILVSQQVAEVLQQLRGWRDSLQDLGVQEVKHGVQIHLYNLCKDGLGNQALPKKLQAGPLKASAQVTPAPRTAGLWKWAIVAGVVVLAAAGAVLLKKSNDPTPPTANTATVSLPERELHYYMMMQKVRDKKNVGAPLRVSGPRMFEDGYRIWLHFESRQPGYLYVLNEGPKSSPEMPDVNTLFPSPKIADGSARIEPGKDLQIPSGNGFEFDAQKGQEKLWMVWSDDKIPELEDLKKWANDKDQGAVHPEQAKAVLERLHKYAETGVESKVDDDKLMTVLKGRGSVIARRIQLDHD